MSVNEPGRARTFDTADPAEHERLRLAWDNFEDMLETPGFVASDLDPVQISTTSSPTWWPSAIAASLRSNRATRSARSSRSGPVS